MNDHVPTVRRIATLVLTILLLATTVPATELAPELPDLVGAADATHDCPVNILDQTSDRGPGPTDCLPCHDDCVPSTDPCDHVDCGTDPCDHVDCNPDPGDPCRTVYKALADLGLYRTSGVNDCIPDPSTEPCDYAGQFISCPPPIPPVPSEPEIVPLDDEIRWTTTYPETVLTVDDGYTLTGGVHNELDVPLLLNVEPHVESPSVCSVQGFSSSSAKPSPRQHEYVLAPNGTETDHGTGTDLLNGDSISFSVDVAVGDVTGTCEVTLQAMVQTIGGSEISVGRQSTQSEVSEPLPSSASLGSVTVDCTTQSFTSTVPEDPIEVEAGNVDVWTHLSYPERCKNDEHASIAIRYRHENDCGDCWTNLTSASRADPGTATAFETADLSWTGTYVFQVSGAYFAEWFGWTCMTAIVSFLLGLGAIGAGMVALLLGSGPLGWSILALVLGALGVFAGALGIPECDEEVDKVMTPYSLLVEAKKSTATEGRLLNLLPAGGGI